MAVEYFCEYLNKNIVNVILAYRACAGVSPLSRRSIHDDVDPEDLHSIQRVREIHERCQGDKREGCYAPEDEDQEIQKNSESITF